jgi:hypothetical protein
MPLLQQKIFTFDLATSSSITLTSDMGFSNVQIQAFDTNPTSTIRGFTILGTNTANATASTSASFRSLSISLGSNKSGSAIDSITITNIDADYCSIVAW